MQPAVEAELEAHLRAELAPDLEVIRPLGAGSTALVFLAREPALKRLVALKVMRSAVAADATARRRFEREAQSAARISHTNVTSVHRVGRLADGRPFIVMEYVDGRSLAETLAARGPLPIGEVEGIIAALACALAAAHSKGIIHRDVHPGNVFVESRTGRIVLSDFGIAGLVESAADPVTWLTVPGQRLGEVRYGNPEQLRGEPATEQSDIYSLGVLAYELTAGRLPFDGESPLALMTAHLTQAPRSVAEFRPDVTLELSSLLERCLAKEPRRRPSTADIPALISAVPRANTPPAGGLARFRHELERRRVYQIAVAYAATAFVVLQGAGLFLPTFPGFSLYYNALIGLTLAGFPVALVLSWLYDVREGRLQRTLDVAEAAATPWQRVLPWIGLAFSVVVVAVIWWLLAGS